MNCEEAGIPDCSGCKINKVNAASGLDCWINIMNRCISMCCGQQRKVLLHMIKHQCKNIQALTYVVNTYYPEHKNTFENMLLLK